MAYIDDIMYIPLRRAFIRPVSSYYTSNFDKNGAINHQSPKIGAREMFAEVYENTTDIFDELRPRNVTNDSVVGIMKEEDFTTRDEHYFGYLKDLKEQDRLKEKENAKFKHTEQDYQHLRSSNFGDILIDYEKSKVDRAVEYDDFSNEVDMVKIMRKVKKSMSENSKNTMKDLLLE
jgi:hypothetical protein